MCNVCVKGKFVINQRILKGLASLHHRQQYFNSMMIDTPRTGVHSWHYFKHFQENHWEEGSKVIND